MKRQNKLLTSLMDELEPTMARKAGRGEMDRDRDFLASRGGQRHGMAESRCECTCRLSTPHPLLDLLQAQFTLVLTLRHSWRWFGVPLRGLESNTTRGRGMTADGGRRGSGGGEVSKRGSRAATRRGTSRRIGGRRKIKSGSRGAVRRSTSRRTDASRGARWAKA